MAIRAKNQIIISGKVKVGLGKGRYYVGQKPYKAQFIKKLGIDPYYGTLNMKLSKINAKKLVLLRKRRPIVVKGFRKGKKSFGDVLCYNASISGIKCALIMPELSTHHDVAEIISSKRLRSELGLKEGSRVKVRIR